MTETIILSAIGAAGLGLAALGRQAWVRRNSRRRFGRPGSGDASTLPNPEDQVPLARYQPMFRLLEGGDVEFLRRSAACAEVTRVWELSHRRIVRLYLKELAEDFGKLHREARIQIARSADAPPHAMLRVMRQQVAFRRALLWIKVRLWLGRGGVARINPEALIAAFEALQHEIARGAQLAQDHPA